MPYGNISVDQFFTNFARSLDERLQRMTPAARTLMLDVVKIENLNEIQVVDPNNHYENIDVIRMK